MKLRLPVILLLFAICLSIGYQAGENAGFLLGPLP